MADLLGVLLPALFAGLVAIAVTVGIERFGGVVGGFLGTLPSTIVPASLGFWASASPEAARDALCMAPTGMMLNAGFLWLWRALPPRLPPGSLGARLTLMTGAALTAWAAGAVAVVGGTRALQDLGVSPFALGLGSTLALFGLGIVACLPGLPAPRARRPVGLGVWLARGVLAALAIGLPLLVARGGDGLLAGIASTFPAIFLTAMVSLWWSHGDAVPAGAVGPMMLGSTSVATYALGAAWALPEWGPVWGVAAPWLASAVGVTLPATLWLRARTARR